VGRGRFRTYIGKPKALDAYYRKLKWTAPAQEGTSGWEVVALSAWTRDRPVDRVAAFRRYHRRWVPKSVTARRCLYSGSGASGHAAKTIDENLTTQCCWRCGKRTLQVYDGSSTMRTCGS
jgi:hypothetical protein